MAVLALVVVMVMEAVTVGVIDRPPSQWVSRGSLVWFFDPADIADDSGLSVAHRVSGLSPDDLEDWRNLNQSSKLDQSRWNESSAIPPSTRAEASFSEPSTGS
jgi:hypothetical protein